MTTKTCSRCGRLLPLSEFHRTRLSPDGHKGVCRDCINAAARKPPEQHRKTGRKPGHQWDRGAWELLHDPTRFYVVGGHFQPLDFAGTLADGNWPDGSVWRGKMRGDDRASRWRVEGARLVEIDGGRVLVPAGSEDRPTLKMAERGAE